MDNAQIAARLESFGMLLELAESNPYTIRAYRRAAETIRATPAPVAELVASGRVQALRGIGPGIAARLVELVSTGSIAELDELERELAPDLVGLGRYLGLTARRSMQIARSLGVHTAQELRDAAAAGRLRTVPGIGPKTEARLLDALRHPPEPRLRQGLPLNRARALLGAIAAALGGTAAGDPRRWREVCERLAVVVGDRGAASVLDRFGGLPQIVAVIEREERRALGVTVEGVPVELVVARPGQFGTELVRATGSDAYVAALEPLPDGGEEAEVYAKLATAFCPPELRERPHRDAIPELVQPGQIRGDLHCHTTWSDGRDSVEAMGRAGQARGYQYLAICDHTPAVGAVPGLTPDDVRRQGEEIARVNAMLAPFRVLRGIECDILPDGTLDLPGDALERLDWVVASVHSHFNQTSREMTERIVRAVRSGHVDVIGHPSGRILGERDAYAFDLGEVLAAAREAGVALEVNASPGRLDLCDKACRQAREAGCKLVISTDAHLADHLDGLRLGVWTARRGWLEKDDVLNTRPFEEVRAALGRKRPRAHAAP
ncbi:MAG TPA: helix-hairpin-helix domain-containing protein [Solirubrobacteraceae bacterium]